MSNNTNIAGKINWDSSDIRIAKLEDGLYPLITYGEDFTSLYIYAKDKNGNYIEKAENFTFKFLPNETSISFENEKFILSNTVDYWDQKWFWLMDNEYLDKNEWKKTSQCSTGKINVTEQLILEETEEINEKECFIKCQPTYSTYSTTYNRYLWNVIPTLYFYAPYEMRKNTDNPLVCELKDFYLGQSGINIIVDQPCFAHTLYCPKNLGDTPKDWLRGGLETGIVQKQKSFTYSFENTKDVPAGYYYTTIVHFADGTTLMTPVQLKK